MATVTVSSKYQIVIPKPIREKMKIKAGQKFELIQIGDHLEFIPVMDIKKMRGILKGKGINSEVSREKDRI